MDFSVQWLEPEQQNIHIRFPESYTWADLFSAIDQAAKLLDSVDYGVNILADMCGTPSVPPLSPANLNRVA
jgi:hypothetical protein